MPDKKSPAEAGPAKVRKKTKERLILRPMAGLS